MEEMPQYLICENTLEYFNQKVSIFNLNLEELVYEKMFLMFEKLTPANAKLQNAEIELETVTQKLLLETDFKSLGLTNEKMRTAHIKNCTAELTQKIDEIRKEAVFYKSKITIINDLIETRRFELKIENTLNEEE